jgi:hypothetical protein
MTRAGSSGEPTTCTGTLSRLDQHRLVRKLSPRESVCPGTAIQAAGRSQAKATKTDRDAETFEPGGPVSKWQAG